MMPRDFQSLSELLDSGGLARLVREAQRHRNLTDRVRGLLPEAEAKHLVSVHTDAAGRWVVAMDSPAWAARLRYLTAELGDAPVRVTVVPRQSR